MASEWQKPRLWACGTEQPRGFVWVSLMSDLGALTGDARVFDWAEVIRYALPATPEGRRESDRIRKANARAAEPDDSILTLPLPQGTRDALARVCERAGFTDRRELIATLIHNLDKSDGPTLDSLLAQTVRAGDLSKYYGRLTDDI